MINITIHRGANQIGGCITEIATTNTKIIIDLGNNLPGNKVKELTIEQVTQITADADAIFYTHYHGDHIGLFHLVPNDIPQYVGKGALEVIKCKYDTLSKHIDTKEEQNTINTCVHTLPMNLYKSKISELPLTSAVILPLMLICLR